MSDRNWPHPVLDPGGADYPGMAFQAAVQVRHIARRYEVGVLLDCGSDTLADAVCRGDACYAVRLHCPTTSVRQLSTSADTAIHVSIPDADLYRGFTLRPYILADRSFCLESDEFAPLFQGLRFEIRRGSV